MRLLKEVNSKIEKPLNSDIHFFGLDSKIDSSNFFIHLENKKIGVGSIILNQTIYPIGLKSLSNNIIKLNISF
jgi:hypothetical protein